MLVGIAYNLKPSAPGQVPAETYAEWDDAPTIAQIKKALEKRHRVCLLDAQDNIKSALLRERPDFVFNIAEGSHGVAREAQVPALLDSLGIGYTGSGPTTLTMCLDKAKTKRTLLENGVPTAPFALCERGNVPAWETFPAIVKPNQEGSSKGIRCSSVVHDSRVLKRECERIWDDYEQPALVEKFLEGREFTIGLLGNGEELQVLPPVEIDLECLPSGAPRIFSYEAKWIWDTPAKPLPILHCPAQAQGGLLEKIRELAAAAFRVLGCRDWCRVDFRADAKGNLFVLEANPLPGILPDPRENSCFPLAARTAGLSYDDLILRVLDIAQRRVTGSVALSSQYVPSPLMGGG